MFNGKFSKDDEYYTPKEAWKNIAHLIPKVTIWEAFYGNGKSGEFLRELGFEVIHERLDFFENNLGDIVVSNPPFSLKKEIITRLIKLGKPFILLMPSCTLNTQYIKLVPGLQVIVPRRRIQFIKDGKQTSRCNFESLYFCYKMNLGRDLILLD